MKRQEIVDFLLGKDDLALFERAVAVRNQTLGDKVYLRGLIELSNCCSSDCLYCGIRCSNINVNRYMLDEHQVLEAAKFAYKNKYGSIVLQAGEQNNELFISYIEKLIKGIKILSNNELGITLSLGEQTIDTYKQWRKAGAHRYLLRIESSSKELFEQIHPAQQTFASRLQSLSNLTDAGFKVGTGVMIGLPFQTLKDLADDILFFVDNNIQMCGMGPYVEHPDTPLIQYKSAFSASERVKMTLRMIAILRICMPHINIASTTALHALDPLGREKGIAAGANVIMPNITPELQKADYQLYSNKPTADINLDNFNIGWGEWGDF